eukprot:jgi/Mesvir1/29093/Mv18399-RA.1
MSQHSTLRDRSMFGDQPVSNRSSSPAFKFGGSQRKDITKVFDKDITPNFVKGSSSPGPVYQNDSSFGEQRVSLKETAPSHRFGVRTSPVKERAPPPGPGAYKQDSTVSSKVHGTPSVSFGSSGRFSAFKTEFREEYKTPCADNPRPAKGWIGESESSFKFGTGARQADGIQPGHTPSYRSAPGPGAYAAPSAIGHQPLSTRSSPPKHSFSKTARDATERVFITDTHSKATGGKDSPGPTKYNSQDVKVTSKVKAAPAFKFGSSDRFVAKKNASDSPMNTLGPGSYAVPSGEDMGQQSRPEHRACAWMGCHRPDYNVMVAITANIDQPLRKAPVALGFQYSGVGLLGPDLSCT